MKIYNHGGAHRASFLAAAFAAALSVFCPATVSAANQSVAADGPEQALQRTVTILSMVHDYDLNPHTASYTTEAQLLSGLYEGLFSYDPVTLDPVNALCASYKLSRNKKRWTFTIKEKATFSDGTPITANTFRNSWLDLLATPNAPYASLLDCIVGASDYRNKKGSKDKVGISVRDDRTLVVHLTEPAEHFPRILCHHAFSAVNGKKTAYSGPFMIAPEEKKGKQTNTKNQKKAPEPEVEEDPFKDLKVIRLVKNPKYRSANEVQIPGINLVQCDDMDENAFLFNTGKVDWIAEGNATAAKVIDRDAVHVAAEFGTYYLFFKNRKDSPWNNKELREALLEAVPYNELRAGLTMPATNLVYPLSGYPKVAGIDDYDAVDAKMLMTRAREKAKIPAKEKLTLRFAITDTDFMKNFAEILKKAWEPLGVELVTEIEPPFGYNLKIPSWDADLFSYSWIGDFADPLAFLELFRSDSSLNVANYKNEEFDALLHKAAVAANSSEHYSLLSKAEVLLYDDSMLIPVYHPVSLHFIDLNVIGGWQTNALDLHPFKYLYIKRDERQLPSLVMVSLPRHN